MGSVKGEHPITVIHRLRDELGAAIQKQHWKKAGNRARSLLREIPEMLEQNEMEYGKPTLEGVYEVGTSTYAQAHEKTVRALEQFNQELRAAKAALAKKKKKKH